MKFALLVVLLNLANTESQGKEKWKSAVREIEMMMIFEKAYVANTIKPDNAKDVKDKLEELAKRKDKDSEKGLELWNAAVKIEQALGLESEDRKKMVAEFKAKGETEAMQKYCEKDEACKNQWRYIVDVASSIQEAVRQGHCVTTKTDCPKRLSNSCGKFTCTTTRWTCATNTAGQGFSTTLAGMKTASFVATLGASTAIAAPAGAADGAVQTVQLWGLIHGLMTLPVVEFCLSNPHECQGAAAAGGMYAVDVKDNNAVDKMNNKKQVTKKDNAKAESWYQKNMPSFWGYGGQKSAEEIAKDRENNFQELYGKEAWKVLMIAAGIKDEGIIEAIALDIMYLTDMKHVKLSLTNLYHSIGMLAFVLDPTGAASWERIAYAQSMVPACYFESDIEKPKREENMNGYDKLKALKGERHLEEDISKRYKRRGI